MIVPMKKYSFLVYHKEYIEFLKGVQELGALHVIEKESGEIEDEETREKYQHLSELDTAIKFLEKRSAEPSISDSTKDSVTLIKELKTLQAEYESQQQGLSQLLKEKSILDPWGDFSWETITKIKEAGYKVHFYICPTRNFNPEWNEQYHIGLLSEINGNEYFILVSSLSENPDLNAEEIKLPEVSLSSVHSQIDETEVALADKQQAFDNFASNNLSYLLKEKGKLTAELDFNKVVLSTQKEAEDKLMFLEGWVPEEVENNVNNYLESSGVYFEAEKPSIEDNPPIKLKNNAFARLYESIGELYTFPNYKELDLTPFFAPFYMLFFGFCLGDAGYGLLIVAGTIYGLFKVQPKLRPLMKLGMYLGIATTIMGSIGGTIFGMNLIDSGYTLTGRSMESIQSKVSNEVYISLLEVENIRFEKKDKYVKKITNLIGEEDTKIHKQLLLKYAESDYPILESFRHRLWDSDTLMAIALMLGYVQVVFGMFLKAANKSRMFGFKYSLSTFGWILIVMVALPAFVLGGRGIIPAELGTMIAIIAGGLGAIPALFYNTPGKNPLMNFGVGLWDTYQTASGLLGDVLSYIRLFALGISSAILGNVFNQLAFQSSEGVGGGILGVLIMILILAFGHSLNFFMAALGSFVHPLRLTFVEFYKNADFMGGGRKYEPFKN